ncbi:Clavaminate synthase-like protein [Pholiota conissans]|uniref:Clavaminate synthase-like protein n=1 Tax=Pholiota conissans TaxID=109636 RepID=A0A9P6CX19_9AGAR|nr:Clavaminate synthase-like protein [Pholiota conissans]
MVAHSELLPQAVKERAELFESFIGLSHFVNKTLLASLSDASNMTLVLLHYPQQNFDDGMGHNKHTDIGSITLLFTKEWGLQLQQPGTTQWSFVAPRDGHAIINIGDWLRFLSGKKFNSYLHRVVPVASNEDRYQIAYFLRPENATHLDTERRRV